VQAQLETLVLQMYRRGMRFEEAVREFQGTFILTVLRDNNGNQCAAKKLGMYRNTLRRTIGILQLDLLSVRPASRRRAPGGDLLSRCQGLGHALRVHVPASFVPLLRASATSNVPATLPPDRERLGGTLLHEGLRTFLLRLCICCSTGGSASSPNWQNDFHICAGRCAQYAEAATQFAHALRDPPNAHPETGRVCNRVSEKL
jgi:hypothetical protein